jgi:uncharacterized protein (AIM24 family)
MCAVLFQPGGKSMTRMHEVDYKIFGDDIQYVEVELDPGEAAVAEAGAMMYMEDDLVMETIFGDGSPSQGGLMGTLLGAGKRLLMGESLFMTVFQNQGRTKRKVAFGAPYPGRIIPVKLSDVGGELIAQKDSFLAAAKGRIDRHCRSNASLASDCSAAKASSWNGFREMALHSYMPAG